MPATLTHRLMKWPIAQHGSARKEREVRKKTIQRQSIAVVLIFIIIVISGGISASAVWALTYPECGVWTLGFVEQKCLAHNLIEGFFKICIGLSKYQIMGALNAQLEPAFLDLGVLILSYQVLTHWTRASRAITNPVRLPSPMIFSCACRWFPCTVLIRCRVWSGVPTGA